MSFISLPSFTVPEPDYTEQHDMLFEDPEKAIGLMPGERQKPVLDWLNGSTDRERDLQHIAVRGYLSDVYKQPGLSLERMEVLKSSYARQFFGAPAGAAMDDGAFYQAVKEQRTGERDRRMLFSRTQEAAEELNYTIDAKGAAEKSAKYFEDLRSAPGFREDDLPAHYAEFRNRAAQVRGKIDSLMPTVDDAVSYMRQNGDSIEGMRELAFSLAKLPDNEVEIVMELARQKFSADGAKNVGKGLPGREKRDEFQNTPALGMLMEGQLPGDVAKTIGDVGIGLARGTYSAVKSLRDFYNRAAEPFGAPDYSRENGIEDKLLGLYRTKEAPLVGGTFKRGLFGVAQSAVPSMMIGLNKVGTALSVPYYTQESYEEARAAGLSVGWANAVSLIAGPAKAALDAVQFKGLSKIPGMAAFQQNLANAASPFRYVAGQSVKGIGNVLGQTAVELTQDVIVDPAAQQVAAWLGSGVSPHWKGTFERVAEEAPDTLLTMTGMVLLGTGMAGINDVRGAQAIASNKSMLRAAGFDEGRVAMISEAEQPVAMLRQLWGERGEAAPEGGPAEVASAAYDKVIAVREEMRKSVEDAREAIRAAGGVQDVVRVKDGWDVVRTNGQREKVATEEAAMALVHEIGQADNVETARVMMGIADEITQIYEDKGSEVRVTSDAVVLERGGSGSRMNVVTGDVQTFTYSPETARALSEQLDILGADRAQQNGANWIAEDGRRMIEVNIGAKDAPAVFTMAHESVERRFRDVASTIEGKRAAVSAIKALADAGMFAPEKASEQDRPLAERVQKIANFGQPGSERPTEAEVRETIVELAVADVVGRLRSGQQIQPGVVSDALTKLVSDNWTPRFFRSIKNYLRGIFGVMSEFTRARREGRLNEGDDWTAFVDRLVGVDGQKAHEAAVRQAAEVDVENFSLQTLAADTKESLRFRMFVSQVLMGNPNAPTVQKLSAPAWWVKLGFDDFPLQLASRRFNKITESKHAITEADLRRIPEEIANPLAVFQSRQFADSVMILTRLEEAEKGPVVVTVRRGKGIHEITSVYGKPLNVIQDHAIEGTLFLNQKEVRLSELNNRVQFPKVDMKGGRGHFLTERDFVKSDSTKEFLNFSLSRVAAEDSRHADLERRAKAGDAEAKAEAQQMVDEAAKAAGFTQEAWHNSGRKFTSFDRDFARTSSDIQAFFFKDQRDPYKEYGRYEYHVYIRLTNPANYRQAVEGFSAAETDDAGVRQREKLQAQGFDGAIISREEGGMDYAEIIAFEPNQIKSADPFTYDENGDLIPLSERFNPQRDEMTFSLSPTLKKRTDVPKSWDEVRPGHLWSSAKKHLPKTGEKRPLFGIKKGSWETIVKRLASWLGVMVNPVDPWGSEVVLANPENGSLETRAEHLTGRKENGTRVRHDQKIDWLGAIVPTIENAQVRVIDGAETLYFRSYKEGIHMVVVSNGKVEDQYSLVTQYAPESREQFEGAVVERIRPEARLAALGRPDSTGLRVQSSSSNAVDGSELKAPNSGSAAGSGQSKILPSGSNSRNGQNFSLSSVNNLEDIADRIESMNGGAKAKLEIYADMARSISGMARAARHNEELDAVLRVGEIERQRRAMQTDLEEQYIEAVWRGPTGPAMSDEESTKLKNEPIVQALLAAGGLMSRGAALRRGLRLSGEYEGSELLPPMFFGGRLTPDQMADVLANTKGEEGDESFLADAYPDTLWDALHQAVASVRRRRDLMQSGKEQILEAKVRAREEARQWAWEQRMKIPQSDKRDEARALVTLDTLLMRLPAEVRGRVGGFTRLDALKTNKARREFFMEKLGQIDSALETYLRNDYVRTIRETIQKGAARVLAGQKDRGKLGVNAHTWLELAGEAMVMSPQRVAERETWIESRMAGDLTEDDVRELTRRWDFGSDKDAARAALEQESAVLELFGGMTHREDGRYIMGSGELEAALEAARGMLKAGFAYRGAQLQERRERRAGLRAGVKIDSGTAGTQAEIEERKQAMEGWAGSAINYFRKGFSFGDFIGDIFGRGSDTHQWVEGTVREAELVESGLFQDGQRKLKDFLVTLWPRSGTAARLRNLEALSTPREIPGMTGMPKLSELQMVHFTMLWADEDSRAWLRRHQLGDGEPVEAGEPAGPDVQAAFESLLSDQAKAIRSFLQERYDAQYDTLNTVYRRVHGVNMPRVRNYAPRAVLHGKDAVTVDPLGQGGLSARGVFAGFTKRRRIDVSAAPVAGDALQLFMQSQRVVSHFVAWAEASGDLRAVLSTSETAPFILAAAGKTGQDDLNKWLTDLESGGVLDAQVSAAWAAWLRANADSALVGKLAVLAKQIPAMYGSAVEIGWGDYLRSLRRVVTGTAHQPAGGAMEMRIMQARGFQRPPEIAQAARGRGARPWESKLRRIGVDLTKVDLTLDWLRNRIGATDAWFTGIGAAVAYDSHYLDALDQRLTGVEAENYALRMTEQTIARTAQPETLANKSLAENNYRQWGRLMSMFQSANRQALFMTVAAFRDGGISSGEAWRKAVTHWVLTGLVTQTVGNIIRDMITDDDDDEWKTGDYARAIVMGPLTGAVYFSPLVDALGYMLGGFERRQAGTPGVEAMVSVYKEVKELAKEGETYDWRDGEKVTRGLGILLAPLSSRWSALGVGANFGRQLLGGVDNAVTTADEEMEMKAKAYRKARRAEADAAEEALSPDEKAALDAERERRRQERIAVDAAQYDAGGD